ncbi:unnamed protein product [Camellia sinensis]
MQKGCASETKKNNGVPASRSQVWMAAYMKDRMSNSDSVNEVMIFTQVMGPERPSRVQTFGLGPSLTDFLEVDIGGHKSRIVSSKLKFRNKFKSNFNGIKCS